MMHELGKQYEKDNKFKASARLHQSKYRADTLKVDYEEYGNRLTDRDAKNLLNYYDGLNVRTALRDRYPRYSRHRDADMLRSEHIPFNFFVPLKNNPLLAKRLIENAFGIACSSIKEILIEYAPDPKEAYLDDRTSFDAFITYLHPQHGLSGIGIEVKYTEGKYRIGKTEKEKVENHQSSYWKMTRTSGVFQDGGDPTLASDSLRQIWRNHLLGLSMVQQNEIHHFTSIILFPLGNKHYRRAIPKYQSLLKEDYHSQVRGCSYRKFIDSIDGNNEILRWKEYLHNRYLVNQ